MHYRRTFPRQLQSIALSLLIVLAGFNFFAPTVQATNITVTTTEDEVNNDGDCSLREAIIAANNDVAVDNCPAGNGADTIIIPAGHYKLSIPKNGGEDMYEGDLDILSDLSILGAGPDRTIIDANGIDRIFSIDKAFPAPEDPVVTISGVTITGGNSGFSAGSGIYLSGNLTLHNSHVRDNQSSAGIFVQNGSTLTVRDSQIYGNSGGLTIRTFGDESATVATILNSSISGNLKGKAPGAGIENKGTLTVVNSTISGNSTNHSGGGIWSSGITNLYNVTISNNSASTDNSLSKSGGGVWISSGTLTARNTIISGNFDNNPAGLKEPDCDGTLTSVGYNLIGDTAGCTIVGTTTGNLTNVNAKLTPLQNNGGSTLTHALYSTSPAIDGGSPSGCYDHQGQQLTIDQRGYLRPLNALIQGRCDIGAFEYDSSGIATATPTATPTHIPAPTHTPAPTYTPAPTEIPSVTPTPTETATATPVIPGNIISVTTTEDELNNDGDCSLREAIIAANRNEAVDACSAGGGADRIDLPAGHYILSIPRIGDVLEEGTEEEGDLDIQSTLTILGAGAGKTIIDARRRDRVLDIHPDNVVTISDVTITGGELIDSIGVGSGIRIARDSELTLQNSRVVSNNLGSGIAMGGSTLMISNSQISENSRSGLVISNLSSATIQNSTISDNYTPEHGGGILNWGTVKIINSTISGNRSDNIGGGISNLGNVELYNVTITNNTADANSDAFGGSGGGINTNGSGNSFTMRHTIISDNFNLVFPSLYTDCWGTIISAGYNLIGNTSGCSFEGNTEGNLTDVSAMLDSLKDNGGPTLTHALLENSPAINAGGSDCSDHNGKPLTIDQRGYLRSDMCDIGAFEYDSPGVPTATNTPIFTATPTETVTDLPPTATSDPEATSTATAVPMSTPTPPSTATPTETVTDLPPTATSDPEATSTATAVPMSTPTPPSTAIPTESVTPTPELTAAPGETVDPGATATPVPTPAVTGEPTPRPPVGQGAHIIFMPLITR